jgi:hypothetical protein
MDAEHFVSSTQIKYSVLEKGGGPYRNSAYKLNVQIIFRISADLPTFVDVTEEFLSN